MSKALEVSGLKKSFGGVAAVRGIDFHADAGEAVALIGSNGAGKTTCFNLINGQLTPDGGRVSLFGLDITGRSPELLFRSGVARTFQITATFASMSVRENVQMALMSRHREVAGFFSLATSRHTVAANELLADVGLSEQASRPCAALAYGDLKRLELAVALANEPRLLLMDEPTAGMSPEERNALMRLALRVCRERKLALLFTEHDMDVVFTHADRIIVMNRGRLIAQGSPSEVRANEEVRAVYLGSLHV
ncbi:MAG: ABC transporter ATP-binding protein [Burkholderiales bacterium]|nr:MAG: ABC transporter ATP-binding protein [Betaproteobacteria bacterium]TAG84592.1 MAG: ABC transporter ATP-binding protein [Burkholderiales bacterium]